MVIRSAGVDDIPGMLALWRQFWEPQDYEANLKTKIEKEPDLVLVAEAEGKIVGTVIGGFDLWWSWIYRIAVDKQSQRCGIGTALVKELGVRFKARGISGAGAIVSPKNEAVLSLLRKFNLREQEYRRYGIRFE